MTGLHEALEMIHEEGLPRVLDRHALLSRALRAGCAALGLKSYPKAEMVSNTVVCLEVPEKLNGKDIVRRLKDRWGTVIAGSRNKLDGRVIRIGTMGSLTAGDVLTDLEYMEATLRELGWAVAPGVGLAAAAAILQEESYAG
jgi:aspartate aminotransferase-like enzyme